MKLEKLNRLQRTEAALVLAKCCGSSQWVKLMTQRRPFEEEADVHAAADMIWRRLSAEDWQEAFAAHTLPGNSNATPGDPAASKEVLAELASVNAAYEKKFGFPCVIFGGGKRAPELLALARARMNNSADAEMQTATEEQKKITRHCLEQLLRTVESID
jgi:2-oxo-4-hydroxy-4-carboxy-5-ureidoimidazoline decarboxylase